MYHLQTPVSPQQTMNQVRMLPWKFDSPLPQPPQAFPKGIHLLMKYFQLVALHHTETPIAPASFVAALLRARIHDKSEIGKTTCKKGSLPICITKVQPNCNNSMIKV
jgi:hypothetical protein